MDGILLEVAVVAVVVSLLMSLLLLLHLAIVVNAGTVVARREVVTASKVMFRFKRILKSEFSLRWKLSWKDCCCCCLERIYERLQITDRSVG